MVLEVTTPALVLGSTQDPSVSSEAARRRDGVALAQRRSGGGAVLLVPGEHVWVDLVVPRDDPLWVDDVGASSWWLGEAWAATLGDVLVGTPPPVVHRDGVSDRHLGRLVCFAAMGPGEVAVGGRKLVGISQRRTRAGARFQCVVHRRFEPSATWALLDADRRSDELARVLDEDVADLAQLGIDPRWSVVEGLLAHLP